MSKTREITIEIDHVLLTIRFTYIKGETQTFEHEGCEPELTIESVKLVDSGVEILDIISDKEIAKIEDYIFENAK